MTKKSLIRILAGLIVAGALGAPLCFAQNGADQVSKKAAGTRVLFASTIADVAEAVRPSVVHIDTTGTMLQQLPINGPFGFHAPQNGPALVPVRGVGSGIVLDSDGRILTNNHVIENAETISVQFFDGSTHPAMLVGSDPFSDLAIIKAEGLADVPPIRFGDSDTMRVGDWVVAIGSPQGLDWTVTMGIISAKHRGNVGDGEATGLEDFIQTDAAINPGNSGGPLLNLDGELIGINSMILSQSSGSEGLGFAIPSSIIKNISDSLIRLGKVVRGDLGIKVQDLSPGISEGLSLPAGTQGTVVVQVIPEAPADQAGLKRGDVILRYANTPVPTAVQLKRAMAASLPGETVDLDIVRDGKAMSLPCVVEDQYALMKRVESRPGYKLLGIVVRSIGADEAKNLGLADSTGVVVTQVVPGSPADQANVNVGDIIFKVGNADVTDPSDFRARIGEAAKSGMALLLIHDASTGTVGYLQVPLKR